jgi:O-glycosyl hydrolase
VGAIRLIPRLKDKVAASYPGTRLAFTEYNYGGGRDISGAIAQADVLGILGREDVFAANAWATDADQTFLHAGFLAFVDYDGQGGRFGDTSVSATTSNYEATSVYASVDGNGDDRVVVVAINKSTGPTNADIALAHPRALTSGRTFQVTSASATLTAGPTLAAASPNSFRIQLPARSVSTIVFGP